MGLGGLSAGPGLLCNVFTEHAWTLNLESRIQADPQLHEQAVAGGDGASWHPQYSWPCLITHDSPQPLYRCQIFAQAGARSRKTHGDGSLATGEACDFIAIRTSFGEGGGCGWCSGMFPAEGYFS